MIGPALVAAGLVLGALAFAELPRYRTIPTGNPNMLWQADRWTGAVRRCLLFEQGNRSILDCTAEHDPNAPPTPRSAP